MSLSAGRGHRPTGPTGEDINELHQSCSCRCLCGDDADCRKRTGLGPSSRSANRTTANSSQVSPATAGEELVGLFKIKKGQCTNAGVTGGTYFRMIQPNGGFVSNNDSPCGDKTFTPLSPGSEGGLSTSGFQPHPAQPFDGSGNGTNNKITEPQSFFGVKFSTATNSKDPQTGLNVTQPKISSDGGALSGDLRAFAAAWSTQHFNQGAPKPDGKTPGGTTLPSGTYNSSSKAFSIEWKSYIEGGPFDKFVGQWHLEGTFEPSATFTSQAQTTQPSAQRRTEVLGGALAATGVPFPIGLGTGLLALGSGGFAWAVLLDRRDRLAARRK